MAALCVGCGSRLPEKKAQSCQKTEPFLFFQGVPERWWPDTIKKMALKSRPNSLPERCSWVLEMPQMDKGDMSDMLLAHFKGTYTLSWPEADEPAPEAEPRGEEKQTRKWWKPLAPRTLSLVLELGRCLAPLGLWIGPLFGVFTSNSFKIFIAERLCPQQSCSSAQGSTL